MNSSWITEIKTGRHFIGRLARNADIVHAVQSLCHGNRIAAAAFSIRGSVTKATFGVFDQTQQVYITDQVEKTLEIIACNGRFIASRSHTGMRGWITLIDNEGGVHGGQLFSETLVYEAEIEIQELLGPIPPLAYDADTGLVLLEK